MKFFDFQNSFFTSIIGLYLPSSEIEGDKLLHRKFFLVQEVGEKDGDGSIRTDQFDDPERNGLDVVSVLFRKSAQILAAWGDTDLIFFFPALNECMHSGERGVSRTAKYKIAGVFFDKIADQLIARVAPIKEHNPTRGEKLQEGFYFISLGRICRDNRSCDGQPAEDIVQRGDKALRIVSFSRVLEAALGVKFASDLGRSRKVVFGSVYGTDRHAMPVESRILGPTLVGQLHRIIEHVLKDLPVHLLAGLGQCAVVNSYSFGPKTTSLGSSEEFAGFHLHPLCLTAGDNGEQQGDELWKREFSLSSKMLR